VRKKRILPLLCSLLTSIYSLFPNQSQAEQQKKPLWYLGSSIELGKTQSPQDFRERYKNSLSYGANLGFLPSGHISIRAPLRYSKFKGVEGDDLTLKVASAGLDLLLHPTNSHSRISPYIKAGASYTSAVLTSLEEHETTSERRLGIKGGAGVTIRLGNSAFIDLTGDYSRMQTYGTPLDFLHFGVGVNMFLNNK